MDDDVAFETLAVHAGRADLTAMGVHAPPIDLSTTNPLPGIETGGISYESMATGHGPTEGGAVYARLWNPTVARFEEALAALERTEQAVAFSTGMAAFTAAVLAAASRGSGRHIVAVRPMYGGTDHLLASGLLSVETTFVDAAGVAAAVRPDTCLVVLETPANPTLELVDIAAVVAAAGAVPVLVDNTFATPVLQNPAVLGAALVLHSATKYLGGHGDAMGGVIACSTEWAEALRPVRAITGALLHPLGAYLLHRGLPTLALRVRAQQATAGMLAERLLAHEAVAAVHYPGQGGSDPTGLVGRQMRGPGAMLALELGGGYPAAEAVVGALGLFTHAVSLGGVDSLVQHPASLTHRPVAPDARPGAGILRLSIGLEDGEDLWRDLERALGAAMAGRATELAGASAG
ncbi:PLP-dependent aspartate aminotransferase family protein [Microcella daejeonensis]|uniref:homocysteine desulfhydrase n=1 Tax=Microcella daejeonensis TaxID=2994971 RepID=A0A9E8S8W8_9MICO|nr:PLP-dependent aspartate aminotransferase family protein [Microcella daejeonensis]WAB81334.1 PLP-dependent aspartate aminotransferase family protein [Microcella daejeonensis]